MGFLIFKKGGVKKKKKKKKTNQPKKIKQIKTLKSGHLLSGNTGCIT